MLSPFAAYELSTTFWACWKFAADIYFDQFAGSRACPATRIAVSDQARDYADAATFLAALAVLLAPVALRWELAACQTDSDVAWAELAWSASWGRVAA
jgi:hypothetical protein